MSDKERLEQIKNKKFFDVGNGDLLNLKDVNWLIEQAEKAEKYREVLEEIKSHQVVGVANWGIEYAKLQKIAHEALEGENNDC